MTLRDATDADLPTIVEIYNSIVPGHMITATSNQSLSKAAGVKQRTNLSLPASPAVN
jgi:L-amino acid N-acyltransferase YncA